MAVAVLPFGVLATITAVPGFREVTNPLLDTDTTLGLLLVQIMVLTLVSLGLKFTFICCLLLGESNTFLTFKLILSGLTWLIVGVGIIF